MASSVCISIRISQFSVFPISSRRPARSFLRRRTKSATSALDKAISIWLQLHSELSSRTAKLTFSPALIFRRAAHRHFEQKLALEDIANGCPPHPCSAGDGRIRHPVAYH